MLFKNKRDHECDKAIAEISRGNKEALSVLYGHYSKMILFVAKSILSSADETEDVLQETMLKVIKHAKTYRAGSNPTAWILSITRNCAKDVLMRKHNDPGLSLDDENNAPFTNTVADERLDIEKSVLIRDALNTLSDREAAFVKLKYYYGLSYKEIASVYEMNTDAVSKSCRRALKKLRKYFSKE
ncbi:MAG: sigma-70 family RNA polymerase sigma factor [Clostridia bacterium]|nr:sigma-70 family RNA polymerase sigma factor [Clostridia bacterium]